MNSKTIERRTLDADRRPGRCVAISVLAICAGLVLPGCATDTSGGATESAQVTNKEIDDTMDFAVKIDRIKAEQKAKQDKERREALKADVNRDIDKVVNCYSGDLRRLKTLGALVHRYEAGAPVESLSTSESFRREYGTGGGGGGGGC